MLILTQYWPWEGKNLILENDQNKSVFVKKKNSSSLLCSVCMVLSTKFEKSPQNLFDHISLVLSFPKLSLIIRIQGIPKTMSNCFGGL